MVSLIATPEQRGVLGQVQALMSLLEGHGNFVMNDLGHQHVAGDERMARVLHQRRQTGGLVQQVHKFLGLEQKMRQYEVGRAVREAASSTSAARGRSTTRGSRPRTSRSSPSSTTRSRG